MSKRVIWCMRLMSAAAILTLFIYLFIDARTTDKETPVFSIADAEITSSVLDPEEVLLNGVSAWDDSSGDLSDSIIIESVYAITKDGYATVTYAVSDHSGNTAITERVVHYTDYASPRFTLSGPLIFEFGTHFDVLDHVHATDVFEGDISRRIKPTMLSTGTSVGEEGQHEVQFRVTNSLGDTSQLVLPVEVYPAGSYNAQLKLTDYLIYLPVGNAFKASDYLAQIQVQGESLDLSREIPEDVTVSISGNVNSAEPGVYPVAFTVVVQRNGLIYTGYTKLLVVIEA